jgi:hypothetical protein
VGVLRLEREEIERQLNDFVDEYFQMGKYSYMNGDDGLQRGSIEDTKKLIDRIRAFFNSIDVPKDLHRKFTMSGLGESYYMGIGSQQDDPKYEGIFTGG